MDSPGAEFPWLQTLFLLSGQNLWGVLHLLKLKVVAVVPKASDLPACTGRKLSCRHTAMLCLTIKMMGPHGAAEDLILPLMLPARSVECLKLQVRHFHAVSLHLVDLEQEKYT